MDPQKNQIELQIKVENIYSILDRRYADQRILLKYSNPFQLLIGVILSAQTTDRQVNEISESLFSAFPDAQALAEAPIPVVEEIIRSTGFFHQKAKNIIGTALKLVNDFNGDVPAKMKDLLTLSGVGRKSANVVLGNIYNQPAVIVDTHFSRVVQRLGLTSAKSPDKIESELIDLLRPEIQTRFSMIINYYGRDVCLSRNPDCSNCSLNTLCNYYNDSVRQ